MRSSVLALWLSACCLPAGDVEVEPTPEVVSEPQPAAEPEPEPEPVVAPAPASPGGKSTRRPKPKTEPKAEPAPKARAKGTVTVLGDAKTVMLLGDGHDAQYSGGGEVDEGAYKLKAWWEGDPVPAIALRFAVTAGQEKVVTCSSSGKWCRSGTHEFGPKDTGR